MSEYIDYEPENDGYEEYHNHNNENEDQLSEAGSIIDDNEQGNDLSFYRSLDQLENVGDVDTILQEELESEYAELDNLEINNLTDENDNLGNIVELSDAERRLTIFKSTFFPADKQELSFKEAILYTIRFYEKDSQLQTTDFDTEISEYLNDDIKIDLDIRQFRNTCYHINDFLAERNYFLRVFELKNKFREIRLKKSEKTTTKKELYSCIVSKFDGYELVSSQFSRKTRRTFTPINIIYRPVKSPILSVVCYATNDISKAYRSIISQQGTITRSGNAFECYYCYRYFIRKDRWQKHLIHCTGIPGVVYNFNNQNLVTYQDNLKHKGDIPITIYFDFETTAATDNCYDPGQTEMFVVSYVMILCFHPHLINLPRIIVERSYGHSLERLNSIDYLSAEQMTFIDRNIVLQLSDAAQLVALKKHKNAVGQMFSIELFFLKDTIIRWFNQKIKSSNLVVNPINKANYKKNPIDWKNDKCYLCKFKLDIVPTKFDTSDLEMTFGDFAIRYEYKFLKNIFSPEQLQKSEHLMSLENYYVVYKKVISAVVKLQNLQQTVDFCELESDVVNIVQDIDENNESINQLRDNIDNIEIKNLTSGEKIPSFMLRLIAYLYHGITDFPKSNFQYVTLTTKHFFKHFYRLIKSKIHLHHSHITGQILGYTHDFCNLMVRENKTEVSVIAHNLMKFDAFFVIKGYRAPAWKKKNISMGGTNITNLNFMSIGSEVKFIDSLKYYQTSLANLTSTLTDDEICSGKKLIIQFITTHPYFSKVWPFLADHQKKCVLDIVSGGKGIIPYEMIIDADSLSIKPEGEFYQESEFYSKLKNKAVSADEYQNSKELFQILKMRDLNDKNDLYNFQDVALLCEIVENRFQLMQDQYGFNPRKCNSSATFSGCVEREMSKVIIALPTTNEHLGIFETTLTGGFSSVNNRLAFDTELLLPNDINNNTKDYNYKVTYNLNLDNEKKDYRIISKILKLDENNQYGYAMTKPMPTGCIRNNQDITLRTFNRLLETVDLNDKIGHLYIVDLKLNFDKLTDRQKAYNEICPSVIEKQTAIDVYERSTYQLLEKMELLDSGSYRHYSPTKKAHATLFDKRFIPLYIEHLAILIKRLGWQVTKIYQHIIFEQDRFKKNFIIRNQKARQNAKNNVEKDFYKLLNNSNFGYDCRNNLDNCNFVPIFNELEDVTYLKKYYNYFNPSIKEFVSEDVIKIEIEQTYLDELAKIKKNDPYYEIKKSSVDAKRNEELEAFEYFKTKKKRAKKRKTLVEYNDYKSAISQNPNIKSVIDFDINQANSIKSLAIQSNPNVNITTRFIKGKMLMFAKTSIQSFNYDVIDVFMFPTIEIQNIYNNYDILKCYLYQNLTDTDSTSLLFLFICKKESQISEIKARKVIFEVFTQSKLLDRLDLSSDFWQTYNVQNKSLKKQVGLYEFENIEKPILITIAINPKEYYELYQDKTFNKKSKGIRKDTPRMDFESFSNRLLSKDEKVQENKVIQSRFQVRTNSMKMVSVSKNKFANLNDKRFYFMNGISSLPFGHPYLNEARNAKLSFKTNIEQNVEEQSKKFIKLEKKGLDKCQRLLIYDTILKQTPKIYSLQDTAFDHEKHQLTRDYILDGKWK